MEGWEYIDGSLAVMLGGRCGGGSVRRKNGFASEIHGTKYQYILRACPGSCHEPEASQSSVVAVV
jgi:hypothetical protein